MVRVFVLALVLCQGCDNSYLRKIEILPGLSWEYSDVRRSRIVSEKYGVLVEGETFVTFYEHGIDVCGGGKCIYFDLVKNVIDDSIETRMLLRHSGRATFDAPSAMGIFTKESHRDFMAELHSVKCRVKQDVKTVTE